MPIYEYVCGKCGGHIEVTQKMSDPPLKTHNIEASCGGPLKKIISMNSFHLKGTGWYKTDYAKSSSSNSPPTSASSNEPSDSGSSDKSAKSSDTGEGKKESSESKGSESKSSDSKGSESKSSSKESSSTPTPAVKTGAGGGKD